MILKLVYFFILIVVVAVFLWRYSSQYTYWKIVTPLLIFIPPYFSLVLLNTIPPLSFFMVSMFCVLLYSTYAYGTFRFQWDLIDTLLVCSILWTGIATVFMENIQYGVLSILWGLIYQFLPYFMARILLEKKQILRSIWALVVPISILAFIAPLEYLYNISLPTLLQSVWSENVLLNVFVRGGGYRVYSTFGHPIYAGMIFSFALFMTFMILRLKVFSSSWKLYFLLLINAIAIYTTVSRTSYYLLLPILLLIQFAFSKSKFRYGLILGVALVAVLFVVMPIWNTYVMSGAGGDEQSSAAYRANLFPMYWPVVLNSPIFGYGVSFPVLGYYYSIDNHFLWVLLRSGIPGFVLFVLPFLVILVRSLFYFAKSPGKREQVVLWSLISYLVFYSVVAGTVFINTQTFTLLYLLLGFIQVIIKDPPPEKGPVAQLIPRWM